MRKTTKPLVCLLFASGMIMAGCGGSTTTKYTVKVNNGTGGGEFDGGASCTVTATVAEGYKFESWKEGETVVSTVNPYTFKVERNIELTAVTTQVTPTKYTVTVLGGEGSTEVDPGTEVTVKAYVDVDDPFVNWTVDGKEVSTTSEYKFKVEKDTTITANYTFGQYVKNVTKDTNKDFKILNLTDIQLHDGETTDVTFRVLDELITTEKPDMITFLGDMLNDDKTNDSSKNVQAVINKIDSYNIPWAPIFGNHDFEDYQTTYVTAKKTTSGMLANWYKAAKNCLYMDGPTMEGDTLNKGNYVVNVIDSTTQKPVESLIFADSRLNGIQENFLPFYKKALIHASLYNSQEIVPSTLFTHIAIPQYDNAFTISKTFEYRDMIGICGADPGKLTAGTEKLFPLMKDLNSTKLMVVGHDHENSYYSIYDEIKLAFSTKSSDGDNSGFDSTVFPLGGSVVKLSSGNEKEFYYSGANNIFKVTSAKDRAYNSDLIGFWKYSGAKLIFDVELPASGELKFNLQGTNVLVDGKNESYLGAWNRLSEENKIDASAKTVSNFGTLTQIEGNKYRFSVDLKDVPLNTGSGETARGDETVRLLFFHNATNDFTVSNLHYEYEEITEKDQVDLAGAVIGAIEDQTLKRRSAEGATGNIPAKPIPTVTLNGAALEFGKDFYLEYTNNDVGGDATVTVVPSGIGAHKYKGSKSSTFKVTEQTKRGVAFEVGKDKTIDFKTPLLVSEGTVIFDVFFTSGSGTYINVSLDKDWNGYYFGYFKIYQNGTFGGDYKGLSIQKLPSDGYYRITCVLKDITKSDEKLPAQTDTIAFLYIRGGWSDASGYIDVEPAV